MRRSKVEHMLVGGVSQKCSPLLACFQVSRNEGHVAQFGHAPVVERLMAKPWAVWLIKVAARSSSDQRVAGQPCCSVVLLAKLIRSSLSEGEKRRGRPDRGAVLESGQSLREVTVAPHPDGVAITVELGGDLKVGGMVPVVGSQNQPASEHQGLGGGARSNEALQLSALKVCERDSFRKWERHR